MKLRAFVIHLARAQERSAHVRSLLPRLPVDAAVLDAVDGTALSPAEINAVYRRQLVRPRYPFALRTGEIACFLSHRKAWQAILDANLDAGLIVEDDVEIDPGFARLLDFAVAQMRPGNYIRFPRRERGEAGPAIARSGELSLVAPALPGLGTQAQLVTRQAASGLLAATETFDRPIDATLQMRWLHPARILAARPIRIREIHDHLGGSVIQKAKKPTSEIVAREWKRAAYRLALAACNARQRKRG